MSSVPPAPRLATLVILAVATFICTNLILLSAVVVFLAIALAFDSLLMRFIKFLAVVQLPMTVMLVLVWGWVAKAPPGMPMGSDQAAGIRFALLISLRLTVLAGAFQLIMLSIPARLLPITLRGWGLRGEGLVVALGVFAVEPELKLRAEQILVARRARGLLAGSRWAGFKQLPRLLRPLFVWSIRSAVHRADVWEQRAMLLRVQRLPTESVPFSPAAGISSVTLSIIWLIVATIFRWRLIPGTR
ncbi:MAG TPA: energy-coupling factor transporter transmembrane component T [Tepidisphaeraceae bacterium]|jgi:energy-coupling factor transporter transmembrane protein EcfT